MNRSIEDDNIITIATAEARFQLASFTCTVPNATMCQLLQPRQLEWIFVREISPIKTVVVLKISSQEGKQTIEMKLKDRRTSMKQLRVGKILDKIKTSPKYVNQ